MDKNKSKGVEMLEKFISTKDTWHPSPKGSKVKLMLLHIRSISNYVRMVVAGEEDYGMEMNFYGAPEENELKFNDWKENIYDRLQEPCTKEYFKQLGFTEA